MKSQYETLLICPWIFEEIEVMRNPLRVDKDSKRTRPKRHKARTLLHHGGEVRAATRCVGYYQVKRNKNSETVRPDIPLFCFPRELASLTTMPDEKSSEARDALQDLGDKATPQADMSLLSITEGENERAIPFVKFIDDVDAFASTFNPPASAELLIGAYSELHQKFKTFETSLERKSKLEYCGPK